MSELWWLVPSFFVIAVLYASVGHGGASGYLALLSLAPAALEPVQMATTALTLNLLVASIGLVTFARAGHFSWRLTWPFALASIPGAFLGGITPVSVQSYAVLLAVALAVGAIRLMTELPDGEVVASRPPPFAIALPMGGAIGWLSGVVGIGGGIFLSPLLILVRWANPQQAAASAACFILVNSIAALVGRLTRGAISYGLTWPLVIAAFLGGLIGSRVGAACCSGAWLKRLLAVVLVVAALKLVWMTVTS